MNRFAWGVQHSSGLGAPPGQYQAKLTVDGQSRTVPFTVLVDPRLAAEGLTAADIKEQFEYNMRVRALVTDANATVARARAADERLKGATGAAADTLKKVKGVTEKLLTQPVRYGKPGPSGAHHVSLQRNAASGPRRWDAMRWRDMSTLRKELDEAIAEVEQDSWESVRSPEPARMTAHYRNWNSGNSRIQEFDYAPFAVRDKQQPMHHHVNAHIRKALT